MKNTDDHHHFQHENHKIVGFDQNIVTQMLILIEHCSITIARMGLM